MSAFTESLDEEAAREERRTSADVVLEKWLRYHSSDVAVVVGSAAAMASPLSAVRRQRDDRHHLDRHRQSQIASRPAGVAISSAT